MSELTDERLSALVLERKQVTTSQLAECVSIQVKMRELGVKPKSLREILVEKGFITAEAIDAIAGTSGPAVPAATRAGTPTVGTDSGAVTRPPRSDIIQIPGYSILNKIGQGGMGSVFKGKQISMDRLVAIKILPPRFAKDPVFVDRFIREAKASAKLNHENVIQGIDVGEVKGIHYFVMEFVEGEPVSKRLKGGGKLPEADALNVALQMTRALDHAHKNQLVHRDVKPENIMMTKDGVAKLCDLGLAKDVRTDSSLTQAGTSVGTPHYIAPEQARGEKDVDIRADLYALGASLYHMLAGQVAFDGPTATVVMTKHVTDELIPPNKINSEISAGANAVVCKAMVKQREHRYQTPAEMMADIEAVLRGDAPTHARGRGRPHSGAHKTSTTSAHRTAHRQGTPVPGGAMLGVIGVVVVLVAVGVGYKLASGKPVATINNAGNLPQPPANNSVAPINLANDPPKNTAPTPGVDLRAAESALAGIGEFEAECLRETRDFHDVRLRYEEFLARYKETDLARRAQIQLDRFEESVQKLAEDWVREAERKIAVAVDANRYAEALAVEDEIPRALAQTRAVARLKESIERARMAQDQSFRDAMKSAEDLAGAGDFAAAIAALRKVSDFGTTQMKKTALDRIAELDRKEREQSLARTQAAEKLYTDRTAPEIEALLATGRLLQYVEANKRLQDLIAADLRPIAARVQKEIGLDALLLSQLKDDVFAGISAIHSRGGAVRLDGIADKTQIKFFPGAAAGVWEIKAASGTGAQMALNPDQLTGADVTLLAAESPAFKAGGPDVAMKLGLMEHYAGRIPEEKRWFDKAFREYTEVRNADRAERVRHFLDLADLASAGSPKEREARERFAQGERSFKDKQYAEARSQLAPLLDTANPAGFAAMTWVKERAGAIRDMVRKCDAELNGGKGPQASGLNVKPVTQSDGRLLYEYTFTDPTHADDWTPSGGVLGDATKWIHSPRQGRCTLEDGNVTWRGRLAGDFSLEIEFLAQPGQTRNLNVLFHHAGFAPGVPIRTYFVGFATEENFLQDMTQGSQFGPAVQATLQSVKPDRLIRIDSDQLASGQAIVPLDSDKIVSLAKGGKCTARIERVGKSIKAWFGTAQILSAQNADLDHGELSLGFYKGRGMITRIRILGSLDPEWLNAR